MTKVLKVGFIINGDQILLVEDNPDDVKLTQRAFKNHIQEHETSFLIAKDGKEAIEYLKKKVLPQIILLDLKLPIVDGFEVLNFIRSHEPTKFIPVIILTSSTEKSDMMKAYKLGANSYIQKPINYKTFLHVVKLISLYWLKLNKYPN